MALVAVYLFWGSTYLAIRVGVRDLPPAMMSGIRYVIAGLLLYPVALRTGGEEQRRDDRPAARQWLACLIVGSLLLVCGNGGVTWAEEKVPSGLAALLVATVPLWMILFAVPLRHERITTTAGGGLLVGIVGVAVLAGGGSLSGGFSGIVLVLGASAAWGLGSVLGHRLPLPRRPAVGAAMQMLAGGVILLIISAATGEWSQVRWNEVAPNAWWSVVWLIGPGSILAFVAYGYALMHLRVSVVSTYAFVNPVIAVFLGSALLGETFTLREGLGTLLVVASVALTLYRPRRGKGTPRSQIDSDEPEKAHLSVGRSEIVSPRATNRTPSAMPRRVTSVRNAESGDLKSA
jgi:drug/metabolite transporter (DMT)-like permease